MHKDIITEHLLTYTYLDFMSINPYISIDLPVPLPSSKCQIISCFMRVTTVFRGVADCMPTITCQIGDDTAGTYDEFQVAQDVKTNGYKTLLGTWNNGAGGFICNYLFTEGIKAKMVCTGGVSLMNLVSGEITFYFLVAQYDK